MVALAIGSLLAVAGLAFVLWPLVRGAESLRASTMAPDLPTEASALDALREIEFDHATGKLSAEDYAALKASYTPLALAELRMREEPVAVAASITLDHAERVIARAKSRARSCASCGPRGESDALFCSDCGRVLADACLRCGAPVESDRARFCTECGSSLAA